MSANKKSSTNPNDVTNGPLDGSKQLHINLTLKDDERKPHCRSVRSVCFVHYEVSNPSLSGVGIEADHTVCVVLNNWDITTVVIRRRTIQKTN